MWVQGCFPHRTGVSALKLPFRGPCTCPPHTCPQERSRTLWKHDSVCPRHNPRGKSIPRALSLLTAPAHSVFLASPRARSVIPAHALLTWVQSSLALPQLRSLLGHGYSYQFVSESVSLLLFSK